LRRTFLRFDLAVPLLVVLRSGPSHTFSGLSCASLLVRCASMRLVVRPLLDCSDATTSSDCGAISIRVCGSSSFGFFFSRGLRHKCVVLLRVQVSHGSPPSHFLKPRIVHRGQRAAIAADSSRVGSRQLFFLSLMQRVHISSPSSLWHSYAALPPRVRQK
jgi:hypothetical protein